MSDQTGIKPGEEGTLALSSDATLGKVSPAKPHDSLLTTQVGVDVSKPHVEAVPPVVAETREKIATNTFTSSVPTAVVRGEKEDEPEKIPTKVESGTAPPDVPNGTVRARSKSPSPALTFSADKIAEKKDDHHVSTGAAPVTEVLNASSPPIMTPVISEGGGLTIVPEPKAADPVMPAVLTKPIEPVAVPETIVKPAEPAIPDPIPKPVEPVIATIITDPPASTYPAPSMNPVETAKPEAATIPVAAPKVIPDAKPAAEVKKPEPKAKAPKTQKARKRAATETGEPRRSKRNKPNDETVHEAL